MALNFNLTGIVNYRNVCYNHLTFAEVEAMGKTVHQLKLQGWHLSDESPLEQLAGGEYMWQFSPITHKIVAASLTAHMNRIENAAAASEFFNRCYIARRTLQDVRESGFSLGFSRADVHMHIGLTTNARNCDKSEWLEDLYTTLSYERL